MQLSLIALLCVYTYVCTTSVYVGSVLASQVMSFRLYSRVYHTVSVCISLSLITQCHPVAVPALDAMVCLHFALLTWYCRLGWGKALAAFHVSCIVGRTEQALQLRQL